MIRARVLVWILGLFTFIMAGSVSASMNPPFLSSRVIRAGEAATVSLSAYIPDSDVIQGSVIAQRMDGAGHVIATIETMNDSSLDGDQIAGDKVYTRSLTFTESSGSLFIQVSAARFRVLKRTRSVTVAIKVYSPPPVMDFAASYEDNLRDSFTRLLTLRSSLTALDSNLSIEELRSVLSRIRESAISIQLNFLSLSEFELRAHT